MLFQEIIYKLDEFWHKQGCIIQQPYDIEVGAGTMNPATFFSSIRSRTLVCCICRALEKTY